jgi:hypothetical protein
VPRNPPLTKEQLTVNHTDDQAPKDTRRLVRTRAFLVHSNEEVFPRRVYQRSFDLAVERRVQLEAWMNQWLELTAIEHGQERPAGDYRLELRDAETGDLVMDWRYVPTKGW